MKYSLWTLDHESIYTVVAYKVKNTNSQTEVDQWLEKDFFNAASFYREEQEINAQYLQTFNNN
jgi:hypothetical protein